VSEPTFDVPGAPDHELAQSGAASVVGELARASGLRLAHFEHRVHLPLPEPWRPGGRPDLEGAPVWRGGTLVEHKYAHFRYDNPVGSFHPGHRGKWTAHELCHALVGFVWRPDATPLFHSLAARLQEVLPVALWYFLDEADLRRCPEHDGPLFDLRCPRCEEAAKGGGELRDGSWFDRGRDFIDRELAAIRKSIRLGRPVGHRFATLDLRSDSLAYVAAHDLRLRSPELDRHLALFHGPHTGHFATFDEVEARVLALYDAMYEDIPDFTLALKPDPSGWAAQDVAWRLACVGAECEGEARAEIDILIERLANGELATVLSAYEALHEAFYVPDPADVFAVGYDLPGGYGRSAAQIADGVAQTCPETAARLGCDLEPLTAAFVADDAPWRAPLARRFAAWLARHDTGAVADLAAYEAAVTHAVADPVADALGEVGHGLRVADGVEVLSLAHDPTVPSCPERPTYLAVRRTSGGDTVVAELPGEDLRPEILDEETRDSLRALGVLVPARYDLSASPS